MNGDKNEWTVATLLTYIERILAERELRYMQMFVGAKEALEKADIALREYKTTANEFRGTLKDQAATFITRNESENTAKELRNLIESQGKLIIALQLEGSRGEGGSRATAMSRTNSQWVIGLTIAIALAVLSGIGSLVLFLAARR